MMVAMEGYNQSNCLVGTEAALMVVAVGWGSCLVNG